MKRLSILLSAILAAMLMFTSVNAFAVQQTKSPYINKTYTHNAKFDKCTVLDGLDISSHNGTVDWNAVKNAGTDFVILRAGVRGYGGSGSYNSDKMFEEYIKAAHNKGLKIGIYFYSQAISTAEAKKEAEFTIGLIKNYKSWINMPVFFDYEFAEVSTGRLDSEYQTWYKKGTHKRMMTDNAKAFCDTIAKAGYTPGIYGNVDFFTSKYYTSELESKYHIWLAHYISSSAVKTGYAGNYEMWQYSSSGYIGSKKFDVNFYYQGANTTASGIKIDAIANQTYTGKALTPAITVKSGSTVLTKGTDYKVTYSNNTNIGTATVTVTFADKYANVSPMTTTFRIVPEQINHLEPDVIEDNAVSFSWEKNDNADGYQILYKENTDAWKIADTTTALNYTVNDLPPSSDILITVRAYKKVGTIVYYGSYASSISTVTKPVKVTGLKVSAKAPTSLTLKWNKQQFATKYEIFMFNRDSSKYEYLKTVNSGNTDTCKITNLKSNTLYYFKIRAIKYDSNDNELLGETSNRTYQWTTVATPAPKSIESKKAKKITYKFGKVSGVSGYQVQWSTSSTFSSNKKEQFVDKSKTSTTIKTAQSKKKYYVRIRAYKTRDGKKVYSPWSSKKSVKTK